MVRPAGREETDTFGLSPRIITDLHNTFASYPEVDKVVVYGSRARGDHRPGSDIDLAVFSPPLAPDRFAELWSEIDALPIAFNIDLVHFEELTDEALVERIEREGKPLYARSGNP